MVFMVTLELLRLFQSHNYPELCHLGVVEDARGVFFVAVLTTNDHTGKRHSVEIGFCATGAPTATWLTAADGTALWAPGLAKGYYDDAVQGVVIAALAASLHARMAPLVERAVRLSYSPERLSA